MDKYTYPPDFMVFIRNRLKENLIIESSDSKQIPLEVAQDGEPGLSTNEIAHVYITPHPEQKTTYTFRLKNPGSLRGISCDIQVIQPKI